jgi:hypothetical protein
MTKDASTWTLLHVELLTKEMTVFRPPTENPSIYLVNIHLI